MSFLVTYSRILREQKRPLRFLLSRLLMKTGLCSRLTIEQPGFRLRFHPTSFAAALWIDPRDRMADYDFMRRYLRPGDMVADVGANIGNMALAAAALVGETGRVMAFEPHPRTYQYLQENLALNASRNVQIFNLAVGAGSGTVRFSNLSTDDFNRVLRDDEADQGLAVPVRALDELTAGTERIDLLKIDVEGYEKRVLEGAAGALARTSCVFYESIEKDCRHLGYSSADLVALLLDAGFEVLQRRIRQEAVCRLERGYVSKSMENLIAVRELGPFLERTGWKLLPGAAGA